MRRAEPSASNTGVRRRAHQKRPRSAQFHHLVNNQPLGTGMHRKPQPIEHCGLQWEDQVLRFYETDRAVITASSEQVRQPIYSKSVNSWRRFEPHLGPLIEVLEPLLRNLPKDQQPAVFN